MPTLHRYADRPGHYVKGVTKGQPVAFSLTAEGEQYLTETLGLGDGARFAGDTLKWLHRKQWAAQLPAVPGGEAAPIEDVPPAPAVEGTLQVRLTALDQVLLDQSSADVARELAQSGAAVLGPLPLPAVVHTYRVLREGRARAYEVRAYQRLVQVRGPKRATIERMNQFALPREIDLQVELR